MAITEVSAWPQEAGERSNGDATSEGADSRPRCGRSGARSHGGRTGRRPHAGGPTAHRRTSRVAPPDEPTHRHALVANRATARGEAGQILARARLSPRSLSPRPPTPGSD